MIRGLREGIGSIVSAAIVILVLVSADPRVRIRMADLARDPVEGSLSAGERASELGNALWLAARDQSLENAPLLVLVVVGAGVLLFMLRT